ncbi:MAG: preprotein translocase subunit SecG [Gammaproteobacteria bacterium]
METIQVFLFIVQLVVAASLILLILVQHGKGADAGAAFGSGASATVFGSQGSGNFLTRVTTVLAIIFLANSLALAYVAKVRTGEAGTLALDSNRTISQPAGTAPASSPEFPAEAAGDQAIPAEPTGNQTAPTIPAEPAVNQTAPAIPEEQ